MDWWQTLGLSEHRNKGVKNSYTYYYLEEWNKVLLRDDMESIYDKAMGKAKHFLEETKAGLSMLAKGKITDENSFILKSQIRYYIMKRFKILDPDTWYKERGQVQPDYKVSEQYYQK